jgi:hypothetical protein
MGNGQEPHLDTALPQGVGQRTFARQHYYRRRQASIQLRGKRQQSAIGAVELRCLM